MAKTGKNPEEKVAYLTTAPIPRLVKELSLPTMISMLVTSFYNMVDTFFVGQINTQSTAAVGIAFSAMALIQAVSFFFGHGSGNFISRKLGAKEYDEAKRMAATSFFSSLFAGIVIAIVGNICITPICTLLGSTETILPYTVSYLQVIFLGTPFIIGSFVLNNQMRFQGSASVSMIGITAGAVLNVVLDPIFIFGLQMGVAGAAWATTISQIFSFFLLWYLNKKQAGIGVSWKYITLKGYYFYNIFKGGIPSLCRQGIGSVSVAALSIAAGAYGGVHADAAIAAMGVVNRITAFANSALIGFGQGFQPICGTNYGAGKYTRVRQAFFFCLKLGMIVLAALALLGIIFAGPLLQLFRDDPQVIEIGKVALRAQCLTFVLNVWVILCTMMLQTVGMAFKASLVALFRQGLFFLPAIALLPIFLGLFGVQTAQTAADLLGFLVALPMGLKVLQTFRQDAPAAEEK